MKNIRKMVRRFDIIIIPLLILLSFLPSIIFARNNTSDESGNIVYAIVSINGEEVDRFQLTGNTENQLIEYNPSPGKYNIIEIDGERIRNKEDNSPQQISVRTGWIDSPGETSLNIPHKLLIEIKSENNKELEIDVIS